MRRKIAIALACSGLAACQQGQELDVDRTATYQCAGIEVTAVFSGQDRANLVLDDRQLSLQLVPAASGAKYADNRGNQFWTKGLDEAMLTLAGEATRSCRAAGG
jgi:membrane-bound inhibitor of C-type lysozyme